MVKGQSRHRRCALYDIFHQFTLVFDEFAREKFVDWFGYSASVSPYILEQFEKEAGYPFRQNTLLIRDTTTIQTACPQGISRFPEIPAARGGKS